MSRLPDSFHALAISFKTMTMREDTQRQPCFMMMPLWMRHVLIAISLFSASTAAFVPQHEASHLVPVLQERHIATRLQTNNNNNNNSEYQESSRRWDKDWSQGLAKSAAVVAVSMALTLPAASMVLDVDDTTQGIPMVTQSEVGKSVRSTIVRGAQLADAVDLQWERFSDQLRDERKCDPRTNRRMFDNGFRRDGTRIGNPVLGALCTPEPLADLDDAMVAVVLDTAKRAALESGVVDEAAYTKKYQQVATLVGPSFARALPLSNADNESSPNNAQAVRRLEFNRDLYTQLRATGEYMTSRTQARAWETLWGEKLLTKLAPTADRSDFKSPFPKPDDTEFQPYNEGALLDALGAVSVALGKLQACGVIGHWEISIPEDDDWNVVTVAVDDDITIGGQILARERNQPLSGSEVVSLMRAAMENRAKLSYKMDTFFIDPTTTRQELYNPTQLLISLSDLGQ